MAEMSRRQFGTLVSAAAAGLVGGAALVGTASANVLNADDKHVCKGQNACKGQGGCKTGDGGCAGKNSCKGKGGCATSAKHEFKGKNACKGQGIVKTTKAECTQKGGKVEPDEKK